MIIESDKYWVWVLPIKEKSLPRGWATHGGKWLIFKEYSELRALAEKLDPFVERGQITCAKFSREPKIYDTPVMCVYCLDTDREQVWNIIAKLGIQKQIWKYDKQTIEDWKPGGRLWLRSLGE